MRTAIAPRPLVICLAGPTATGKTELALEIADGCDAEIVSVDSALVYRHMDIGTAKPTADEREQVPHHLIDICEPTEGYSAGRFVDDASRCIDEILGRNRTPLLVGGTMLYFKALWQGMAQLPSADPAVRRSLDADAAVRGWAALHADLARVDPEAAARIAPTDRQRIQRALEVHRLAGKSLTRLLRVQSKPVHDYRYWRIGLIPNDRAPLWKRIESRLDAMFINGFVDEIKQLYQFPGLTADHPAMRAVGYRQLWQVQAGSITLSQARQKILAATRQLAKRQTTWLRSLNLDQTWDPLAEPVAQKLEQALKRRRLRETSTRE